MSSKLKAPMRILQEKTAILHNRQIGPVYYRMGFASRALAAMARPGQFVMARVAEAGVPLLRRPFSIHRTLTERNGLELLYKVVGHGTQMMSQMKAGDDLDVLGPLGNGFWYPEGMDRVFLVAGGAGVASLYFLARDLLKNRSVAMTIFLGGCSAADILCREEFAAMGADVRITTEDCSLGETGLVTSAVQRALEAGKKPDMIFACGPQAMLKAVGALATVHSVPCQISLEAAMACGFGVCLGCAVEKSDSQTGYYHVCKDGPVFDSRQVRIENNASVKPGPRLLRPSEVEK